MDYPIIALLQVALGAVLSACVLRAGVGITAGLLPYPPGAEKTTLDDESLKQLASDFGLISGAFAAGTTSGFFAGLAAALGSSLYYLAIIVVMIGWRYASSLYNRYLDALDACALELTENLRAAPELAIEYISSTTDWYHKAVCPGVVWNKALSPGVAVKSSVVRRIPISQESRFHTLA